MDFHRPKKKQMHNIKKWDVIVVGLGDLGHRVAESLAAQGHTVLGIRRQTVSRTYPTLAMDIHSKEVETLALSCRCLVYAVAADKPSPEGYLKAYPEGIARALKAITAERAIFIGSTRIYGQTTQDWIDEDTVPHPTDWAGEALYAAEQHLRPGDCALILGGIYGPNRDRMLRLGKQGAWCQPGKLTNRIHIVDAARLCVLLSLRVLTSQPLPPRVLGVDGEGADMASVLDWCRSAYDVGVDADQERHPPVGKKCRSARFESLDFTCLYPTFREGYRAMMAPEDTP